MKLGELIAGQELRRMEGDIETEITGLSYDSRQTKPGDFYFSLARDAARGQANVSDALSRGARAVVMRGWDGAVARPANFIECERPRRLMGAVASRFYAAPSERLDLIGVTGTSGKTTTTYLLASIFEAAGEPIGIIGTIGAFVAGRKIYRGLTTPESLDFERALSEMVRAKVRHAAAEVSSIGIEEGRVDNLSFRACVFTNLGRDHLDYHGTIESYFAAKLRLFTEIMPRTRRGTPVAPVAIVRGDDPFGKRVLAAVRGDKLSFGLDRALDVHPVSVASTGIDGIRATISALGKELEIDSLLIGEINLLNILAAAAVSAALGIEKAAVMEGVRRCPGAPGRLERVAGPPGVTILVDYAHKPDALEAVLNALRAIKRGRLVCVFGCGGDRDRGKRPLMGEIAGRLAEVPILTSDNPRTEDPMTIIAEVEAGLAASGLSRIDRSECGRRAGYLVEPDRRAAIALALTIAASGDIVIIAGKGHEDYQLVGDRRLNFDDRVVAGSIVAELARR